MRILSLSLCGLALLVGSLSGCTPLLGTPEEKTMFVLSLHDECIPKSGKPSTDQTLFIKPIVGSRLIDSTRILFSRSEDTVGFYQRSSWSESPTKTLTEKLLSRIECENIFTSVSKGLTTLSPRYVLGIELTEYRFEASASPGTIKITARAELSDTTTRTLIGSHYFTISKGAPSYDAKGAVAAFASGSDELLSQVIDWVRATVIIP